MSVDSLNALEWTRRLLVMPARKRAMEASGASDVLLQKPPGGRGTETVAQHSAEGTLEKRRQGAGGEGTTEGKRNALVVGIGDHVRSVTAAGAQLARSGFEVAQKNDVTQGEFLAELQKWKTRLRRVGTVVFYFGGDIVQAGSTIYLVPHDCPGWQRARIVEFGVHLQQILKDVAFENDGADSFNIFFIALDESSASQKELKEQLEEKMSGGNVLIKMGTTEHILDALGSLPDGADLGRHLQDLANWTKDLRSPKRIVRVDEERDTASLLKEVATLREQVINLRQALATAHAANETISSKSS